MPTPLAVILIAAVPAVAQPRTGARPATTAQHPRAAAPTQGPAVPNPWPELASKLRAKGCELVESRPTKDEAGRILRSLGLIETPAKFYRVKADDKGAVVVAVCESAQAARAMVQKRLPPGTPYAIWRNVLIVRSGTNDHWGQLTDALERLRAAARIAHERGLSNLLLHIALLFGEWLREAGRPADATRIWHMVAAHPQADAGMRDSARRSIDAQPPHGRDEGEPATLSAVIDQLLSDPAPGSDAPRADKR